MNHRKLDQLFHAVRNEPPASPTEGFDRLMLQAIRREERSASPTTSSLFDQLNVLFPRLAWAAVAVIALSLVADYGLTASGTPGLNDGVAQISTHWLFLSANGF